jgi:2'-5' RNA ligase
MARTDDTVRRIFLAVDIDDDLRHGLAAHLKAQTGRLPGSTPPPPNWHITLRFLGKAAQPAYEVLLSKLDQADLGNRFTLGFGGLGAFPRPAKATVLWLGIERGAEELTQLAAVVEEAAVSAGFMPEERPFHPHLTLSRIRPPEDVRALVEEVPVFPLTQGVSGVAVFASHLGGGPAVYELLDRFELG